MGNTLTILKNPQAFFDYSMSKVVGYLAPFCLT